MLEKRVLNRRTWGYWTEQKLSMLEQYLPAFTTASARSPRTLYLDLFAGDHENLSRTSGAVIKGSPRVALDTSPPISRVVLFELPSRAARLERQLRAGYPGRDLIVVPGDCNDTVGPQLTSLARAGWDMAPSFALVDQYAAEIRWSTLERLSRFKRPGMSKMELWLLFSGSMLPRGLAGDDPAAVERFAGRITAMYGSEDWRDAYLGRRRGLLSGVELWDSLLDLMRWRLENELRYRVTHAFAMRNTRGTELYNMIFATDHLVGEKIMRHIYSAAAESQPAMRAEAAARALAAREEQSGQVGLFAPLPRRPDAPAFYVHRPPAPPYRLSDR